MSFDSFTISALLVVFASLVILLGAMMRSRRQAWQRLDKLEKTVGAPRAHPIVISKEIKEMCGAIHRLYPCAKFAVDFELEDDGSGPRIREWRMPVPQPSHDELMKALKQYRKEQSEHSYREARLAEYPSIPDQLDAMHKARHGDPTALRAIDQKVAEVKARHPKPGQC